MIPFKLIQKYKCIALFGNALFTIGRSLSYWENFEQCKVWFCIIHNAYQICMMVRGGWLWVGGWELRKRKLPLKDITYSSGHLHPNSHACRYAVAYISYTISWVMGISYSTKYARILHTYVLFRSCLQFNRSWNKPVKVTQQSLHKKDSVSWEIRFVSTKWIRRSMWK